MLIPGCYTRQEMRAAQERAWERRRGFYDCSVCLQEGIDPVDTPKYTLKGQDVCKECIRMCPECGEYIDGEGLTAFAVRFRDWTVQGKLSDPHHLDCVIENKLCSVADLRTMDGKTVTTTEVSQWLGGTQ